MGLNEQQYERVAQWLDAMEVSGKDFAAFIKDGQTFDLSPEERLTARQIHQDEAMLQGALDVELPAQALQRARRRAAAELARPRRIVLRVGFAAAAATAVAAAIVIAVTFWPTNPSAAPANDAAGQWASQWINAVENPPRHDDVDILAMQAEELKADMVVSLPAAATVDYQMDSIQQSLDEFWLDDPASVPAG